MNINRVWAMPNSNTFSIKPIKELLDTIIYPGEKWIDAFANESKVATITNDLNPEYNTDYHMDALDFFKMFEDNSVDGVLYDPHYSLRQVVECYKSVGKEVTQETTQSSWRRKHIDEIRRILKPNGRVISFGWNSSGVGKVRGFTIEEILLIAHGGSHNDTIVTVERKLGAA
jgi:SAM-dependent methyltransferase